MKESERVITVQETEKAERIRSVELVEARKVAERNAISIQVAAEAEKLAAIDQAEAVTTAANAAADRQRIEASGEAEAEKLKAEAANVRYAVDAAGEKALNAARNTLSQEQIAMQVRLELMRSLPEIIRESVKPMEQIDGIKIIQVDGLTSGTAQHTAGEDALNTSHSLSDQLVNSALRYRSQAPLVDSLLADIGIKGSDLNGLTEILKPEEE